MSPRYLVIRFNLIRISESDCSSGVFGFLNCLNFFNLIWPYFSTKSGKRWISIGTRIVLHSIIEVTCSITYSSIFLKYLSSMTWLWVAFSSFLFLFKGVMCIKCSLPSGSVQVKIKKYIDFFLFFSVLPSRTYVQFPL